MIPSGELLEIAVERTKGIATLSLSGELSLRTVPALKDEVTMVLADEWITALRFNLFQLHCIDRAGLWIMSLAERTAADRCVDFAICDPSPAVVSFLGATRLREFMQPQEIHKPDN